MNFFANVIFFIFLLAASTGFAATNKSRFWPAKIRDISRVGKLVRISYDLPCGSRYYATLARAIHGQKRLELNVLTVRSDGRCTKVAQAQQTYLRSVEPNWQITVPPLEQGFSMRSKVTSSKILSHHVRLIKGRKTAEIAFVKTCRTPRYIAIREEGRRLRLGLIDLSQRPDVGPCSTPETVSAALPFIDVRAVSEIKALPAVERPSSVSEHNRIKLARVTAINRSTKGTVVTYRKACNEIGVALALGAQTSERKIGVVVVSFPKIECQKRGFTMAQLTIRHITPIQTEVFTHFDRRYNGGLLTLDPAELSSKRRNGDHTHLRLSYVKSCEKTIGAVYSNDRHGQLAVGVLLFKHTGRICRKAFRRETLGGGINISPSTKTIHPLSLDLRAPKRFEKTANHSLFLPGWIKS